MNHDTYQPNKKPDIPKPDIPSFHHSSIPIAERSGAKFHRLQPVLPLIMASFKNPPNEFLCGQV
jgi:hypothetical protein